MRRAYTQPGELGAVRAATNVHGGAPRLCGRQAVHLLAFQLKQAVATAGRATQRRRRRERRGTQVA